MSAHRVIAVDVGGSAMKAAVVDHEGGVHAELRRRTPHRDAAAVVDAIVGVVEQLRGGFHLDAVGVVVPGIVDERRGVAVHSVNLGWRDLPLRDLLGARLAVPVSLGHDVRAGGMAELRLGAARGAADVLFVPVGTGVAGAALVAGRPVVGVGYAGELGHVRVDDTGEVCGCGGRGCLETVASAAAITRRYTASTGRVVTGAEEVLGLVNAGDEAAHTVWSEAMDAFARVLVTAVTVTAPEMLVLGGGLAKSGETLLSAVRGRLEAWLPFEPRPTVVGAALGDLAGCLGAGLLAIDEMTAAAESR